MNIIVLIGGLGSGKSSVARMLHERGAAVVDLDRVGHAILHDPEIQSALADAFGADILRSDASVNRTLLAVRAFASAQSTDVLNSIAHPAIARDAQQRLDDLAENGCRVVAVEVSAYNGPGGVFDWLFDEADAVVAVCAPEDVRLGRAVAAGLDEADARARMQRQPTDAQRVQWADFVIDNASTREALHAQVARLWDHLAFLPDCP